MIRSISFSFIASALLAAGTAHADGLGENPAGEPWTFSAAPKGGVAVPTSRLDPFAVVGAEIGYALPVLDGQLVAAFDGTYTRPPFEASVSDDRVGGEGGFELDVTEVKLSLGAVYRFFGPERAFIPFAGGGPVLHLLRTTERDDFDPEENTHQNSEVGAELVLGADYRLGPGYVVGESRFLYSDLAHRYTGDTNAGNVTLALGYRAVF